MSQTTSLNQLQTQQPRNDAPMSLLTGQGFDQIQRVAKALSASTLVPVQYRAFSEVKEYGKVVGHQPNGAGLPNCIVALNMAQRMGADPLMVMQNLYVIEGRPSWSSQFIIASINSCGRFSPLRFDLSEPGKPQEITYTATVWKNKQKIEEQRKATVQHQTCRAWVIEKETGDRLDGPMVSIQMAIDEGWLTKNGSKWLTMPEIMLRYRAASLLGRLYAPELLMGLQTVEETQDFIQAERDETGSYVVDVNDLRNKEPEPPAVPVDDEEGEPASIDHQPGEQVDLVSGEITQRQAEPDPEPVQQRTTRTKPRAQVQQQADLDDDLSME
ncbi:hypothetical protein ACYCFK_17695 [Stutzerimonas stutzeri]